MTFRISTVLLIMALVFAASAIIDPSLAHASKTSGLPWDGPLQKVGDALTGTVAYYLSLLGIFVSGAVLVFGGEINQFVRSLAMVVLVASVMAGAGTMMEKLFTNSAVVTQERPS